MNPEARFRLAAGAILVAAIAIAGAHRARADRRGGALPAEPRRSQVAAQAVIGLVMWGTLLIVDRSAELGAVVAAPAPTTVR